MATHAIFVMVPLLPRFRTLRSILTVRQQFMKKELQNRFITKITTPTNFALIHPIFTFGVHNSYIDLLRTFQYNGALWT